ncbi:MFS transporter [Kiritimatiella glycovorans]|uniref:Inner membrane symporter YicJ n=1 Tax=Kiritimatiella glycovorans TaxID=1307763 RepID=A0A0G3EIE4_9BACT|nr:MFS transporter [Kiritimatiella glycovorans]AKJ64585.1 Inner membrane symporter YicJ [Kiritimatiella glycovorans]
MAQSRTGQKSQLDIFKYAVGDGAFSITMNGMSNFAMIYLTQILGLNPAWASLAISVAIFWDAITDPIMGHISDNTRTRWGRRHPYVLIGGFLSAALFVSFWTLPQLLSSPVLIFIVALVLNLMIRTALTVYMVPYTALGFEICPEYESRARLQGARFFINQTCNFLFGAMAWSLFFQEEMNEAGEMIDGALIPGNYLLMAISLGVAIMTLVSICCWGTRNYAVDNRKEPVEGNSIRDFWVDFSSILRDRLALAVFGFFMLATLSFMLMAQTQMFTYVFFMKFSAFEKTFVHGGGMLAFAFASLNVSRLVRRFDKKPAGFIGIGMAVFGGLSLLAVFIGGLMEPGQIPFTLFGKSFSVATLVFGLLQMCWWGGCGFLVPLASSMIADVAAINEQNTGKLKNAGYASVFTFCAKAAGSIGMFICGSLVGLAGIVSGATDQTPEAVRNIAILTFISGPVVICIAGVFLYKYPVTRVQMEAFEKREDA